jgi:chromosome segregation ATPase
MGSFFQTIKEYLGVKMDQVQDSAVGTLVKLDTDSAIQAEVRRLEQELDKATTDYVQGKRGYDREQKEADLANSNYNRMLAAAEDLDGQAKAAEAAGKPEAATIRASLDKLVTRLEELRPEVEREIEEAKQAKAYMEQLEQFLVTLKKELQNYKGEVEKAKRGMQSAELQAKMAQKLEEQTMKLAGLQQRSSNLKIVLNKINQQTEESTDRAAKAKIKAEMFTTKKEEEDPLVAAALAKASGVQKPTGTSDRLAALRKSLDN